MLPDTGVATESQPAEVLPPLTVAEQATGSRSVRLVLKGELDRATLEVFGEALARAEKRQPALLGLDLADVSFIDVGGLRALLEAGRRADREDRRLTVINPSNTLRRLLVLTALDRSLHVVYERAR